MPFGRNQLRYFVTVAEEGKITLAAERLQIAQPALSQAIASLESDVGFQLLKRHRRGVILTPFGELFLEKARTVLAAEHDASETAISLAQIAQARIAIGYLGLPPTLTNPELTKAFTNEHPDIELSPRELTFPSLPTVSWLRDVDAAICSRPAADPQVLAQPLCAVPRAVLVPRAHRLAGRRELSVSEVLDETFLGFHPSIDPEWAGFWSLDDHRGGPPRHVHADEMTNAQQRFAALATGRGLAVTPATHAEAITCVLPGIVAIPLTDAEPAILTLVARKDRHSRCVETLFATARQVTAEAGGMPPEA